jgi:hypothetical protein
MNTHMCPSISVLTCKSAKRNAFVRIGLTNHIGDRSSVSSTLFSLCLKSKSRRVLFQVGGGQLSPIRVRELDLEESVVTNEDDVIVCCGIEFVGGVLWDGGISTGVEPGHERHHVSERCERTYILTATCTSPCKVGRRGPSRVPTEH